MRDLNGRVDRLEKRLGTGSDNEMIIVTVPHSDNPAAAQKRALEAKGYTETDIAGRDVLFITSYASQ
jgi:hypothetical protein